MGKTSALLSPYRANPLSDFRVGLSHDAMTLRFIPSTKIGELRLSGLETLKLRLFKGSHATCKGVKILADTQSDTAMQASLGERNEAPWWWWVIVATAAIATLAGVMQ